MPMDRALQKTVIFLKQNGLKAVPFDKGVGYCIMTETDYHERLRDVLQPPQFLELSVNESSKKPYAIVIEDRFNKSLLEM